MSILQNHNSNSTHGKSPFIQSHDNISRNLLNIVIGRLLIFIFSLNLTMDHLSKEKPVWHFFKMVYNMIIYSIVPKIYVSLNFCFINIFTYIRMSIGKKMSCSFLMDESDLKINELDFIAYVYVCIDMLIKQ